MYTHTIIFKNYGIYLVSSNNNNLKALLGNGKDKIEKGGKSGINKINCEKYDKCYVRQTKRNIGIKFKEHLRNMKNQEKKSPVTNHSKTIV